MNLAIITPKSDWIAAKVHLERSQKGINNNENIRGKRQQLYIFQFFNHLIFQSNKCIFA